MSKKILFFGNERLATGITTAAPVLQDLIAHGYEIGAVVVAQNELGKSRSSRQLEVGLVAEQHGIPLLSPVSLADPGVQQQLTSSGAQAAVLVAYGKLVPPTLLTLFPRGIINIHPSLLPLHRGSTPIESVILEGATETGVSLMQLAEKMDAGPIYAQERVALSGTETKQGLSDQLLSLGTELLRQNLPGILDGSTTPQPQNDADATYDEHIDKPHGVIDWAKPAIRLEREVRAYAGWPRSRATLGYTEVIITAAHTQDGSGPVGSLWLNGSRQIGMYTGDGILVIDSLVPAGKKEMSAQAFLAGYTPG